MCLPRFLDTAGLFKGLQRAINAFAAKSGDKSLEVDVDARIGPLTLASVQRIAPAIGAEPPKTVEELSAMALSWASAIAKAAGIEPNFAIDPTSVPASVEDKPVPTKDATAAGQKTDSKSTWYWWAAGAIALLGITGLGIYLYKRSKGRPMLGDGDDTPPEFGDVIDV